MWPWSMPIAARRTARKGPHFDHNRMESIEQLVSRRQTALDYLKRCHQRSIHLFNAARLLRGEREEQRPADDKDDGSSLAVQVENWFLLGMSAASIVLLPSGEDTVRACAQLREEFLHHVARRVRVSQVSCPPPGDFALSRVPTAAPTDPTDPVRPALVKIGKQVMYRYLYTPHIPSSGLDRAAVVSSLCEVLSMVYGKFLDPSCTSPPVLEALNKFDATIQQFILDPIVGELRAQAIPVIDEELAKLTAYVGGGGASAGGPSCALAAAGGGSSRKLGGFRRTPSRGSRVDLPEQEEGKPDS